MFIFIYYYFHTVGFICCVIIVGCQNTPGKGSRYCSEHIDNATTFRDDVSSTPNNSPQEIDSHCQDSQWQGNKTGEVLRGNIIQMKDQVGY